jgi:hypothetical protein
VLYYFEKANSELMPNFREKKFSIKNLKTERGKIVGYGIENYCQKEFFWWIKRDCFS